MGIEDRLIRGLDRRRADDAIEAAHGRARERLTNPSDTIQEDHFTDLYGQERVGRDKERVAERQKQFAREETPELRELKKTADVLEAIMLEHAELSDWLGSDVSVLKSTEFDDIFNGIDLIAEWRNADRDSNVLALGVDVTFGVGSVRSKLNRIKQKIDQDQLATVSYFQDSEGTFRGERRNVPLCVIGVGRQTVQELAGLWMADRKRELGAHPVQHMIIDELIVQLRSMHRYAKTNGKPSAERAYARALATVESIKEQRGVRRETGMDDPTHREIITQTRDIFGGGA